MKRTYLLFISVLCAFGAFSQSVNQTTLQYIEQYRAIALQQEQTHKIPACITLAQGILESGSGTSRLAVEANNHFGIKCHSSWEGGTFYKDDDRANECFRAYTSAEESFEDHAQFLKKKRYSDLFTLDITDYKGWAKGLKAAGYATNPKYPELLINLIELYGLHNLSKEPSETMLANVEIPVQKEEITQTKNEQTQTKKENTETKKEFSKTKKEKNKTKRRISFAEYLTTKSHSSEVSVGEKKSEKRLTLQEKLAKRRNIAKGQK